VRSAGQGLAGAGQPEDRRPVKHRLGRADVSAGRDASGISGERLMSRLDEQPSRPLVIAVEKGKTSKLRPDMGGKEVTTDDRHRIPRRHVPRIPGH
jgi:hypothetical protein